MSAVRRYKRFSITPMQRSFWIIVTFILLWDHCIIFSQNIFYVKSDAVHPAPDGKSWEKAFPSLQTALETARYGDRIWVATGTYKPTEGTDRLQSFVLKNGVQLYGGFQGHEATPAERDWQLNPTILSGDIASARRDDNTYHVVFGRGLDSITVLDGFIIRDGYSVDAPGFPAADGYGAGMLLLGDAAVYHSKPRIANCHIIQNAAHYGGGIAIRWEDPDRPELGKHYINPVFENCTIERNYAYLDGGGILKTGSMPVGDTFALQGCSVLDNRAKWGSGGGIRMTEARQATLLLDGCLFARDSAVDGGAVLFTSNDEGLVPQTVILRQTTFSRNYAIEGSGLYYSSDWDPPVVDVRVALTCMVDHCLFEANKTRSGKGCFFIDQSENSSINLKIYDTQFRHNLTEFATSQVDIGSLGNNKIDAEVVNCIFLNNVMTGGTGPSTAISFRYAPGCSGKHTIKNCLFKDNSAGLAVLTRVNAKIRTDITNCTFYNNNQYILLKSWYDEFLYTDTVYNNMFINNSIFEEPRSDPKRMFYPNDPNAANMFDFKFNYCMVSLTEVPLLADADRALSNHVILGTDPLFRDITADDLRLDPCSPAIGAGLNRYSFEAGLNTDLNGEKRILFNNVDLGAYEHSDSCGVSAEHIAPKPGNAALRITPNPSSDGRIRIDWPADMLQDADCVLHVYDLGGRLVATFNAPQPDQALYLSALANGVYLIRLLNGTRSYEGRWVLDAP